MNTTTEAKKSRLKCRELIAKGAWEIQVLTANLLKTTSRSDMKEPNRLGTGVAKIHPKRHVKIMLK
jgi:hypothetical protein